MALQAADAPAEEAIFVRDNGAGIGPNVFDGRYPRLESVLSPGRAGRPFATTFD